MSHINAERLSVYLKTRGLTVAGYGNFGIFVGDENPYNIYNFKGNDHTTLCLKGGVPYSFIIQPYPGSNLGEDIKRWNRLSEQFSLFFKILPPEEGWYNPGRTTCVEFTREEEFWRGDKALTYKCIIGKMRSIIVKKSKEEYPSFELNYVPCAVVQNQGEFMV